MKIDFSQVNQISNVEKKTEYNPAKALKEKSSEGYQLDISGKVKDNATFTSYGKADSQKKTIEECMQEAGEQNVTQQRNYMAVMSNSLSTEDYKKLEEDGFHPGEMTPENAVTVVDQIKVKLAEAGVSIKGYTDTVQKQDLEAVTGSVSRAQTIENKLRENDLPVTKENMESAAQALSMMDQITEKNGEGSLNDSSMEYLVSNGIEPTIEQTYFAEYSSSKGYQGNSEQNKDYEGLSDQIEKAVIDSGFEADDETIENAKWLFEKELPITKDTLQAVSDLKQIELPISDEDCMDQISNALSEGKDAKNASLVKTERVFAEIRLSMTTEANRKLLESDYSIDTTNLEKQVEDLKKLEEEISGKINEIKEMPAATIAEFTRSALFEKETRVFTLNDVYNAGTISKNTYEKAGESYEALQTEIRPDLGDSIQKAFQNVSDILQENGLEDTESNQRAVRILSYNQMDVTKNSILEIKEADSSVNRLLSQLTPAATLQFIRNGENPLLMNVETLSSQLEAQQTDGEQIESYSKFLCKLENNQEITPEERESYIGIYRLFRQVEKSDGAAIGAVVNNDEELTLKNLLSAVRSQNVSGMDYTIDESFGGVEASTNDTDNQSISLQIEMAFAQAKDVRKELDPDKLLAMNQNGTLTENASIEKVLEGMRSIPENMDDSNIYYEEQAEEIRQAVKSENQIFGDLLSFDTPLTIQDYQAANGLFNQRGSLFKGLSSVKSEDETKKEKYEEVKEQIIDGFTDEDAVKESYQTLQEAAEQLMDGAMDTSENTYLDIRNIQLLHKELSLVTKLSREESYEVPIQTAEGMQSIHLKIIHQDGESKVEATMNLEDTGSLYISMTQKDNVVNGFMMAEEERGVHYLEEKKDFFEQSLNAQGKQLSEYFSIMQNKDLNINEKISTNKAIGNDDQISTKELYQLAKTFLQIVNERGASHENL